MSLVRSALLLIFTTFLIMFGSSGVAFASDEDLPASRIITVSPNAMTYGVAVGPTGKTYVSELLNNQLIVYSTDASGAATPIATIPTGNHPFFLTVGNDNRIYVGSDYFHAEVYVFDANGNSLGTLTSTGTLFNNPVDVALDAAGNIYVSDFGIHSVFVFPPLSIGATAPVRVIQGAATTLQSPVGIHVEPNGGIWVANRGNQSVDYWPPLADGDVAPSQTIKGSSTGLNFPQDVTVALGGQLAISNNDAIALYPKTANGDIPPTTRIIGSQTGLTDVWGLSADNCGSLYAADTSGSISIFNNACPPPVAPAVLAETGANTFVVLFAGASVVLFGATFLALNALIGRKRQRYVVNH